MRVSHSRAHLKHYFLGLPLFQIWLIKKTLKLEPLITCD